MSRFIDAEKFKHIINNSKMYGTMEWHDVLEMLMEVPTADVVEVKHGVWLEDSDGNLICSKCKFKFYPIMFKFCPNCGADMRLKGGSE